MQEYFGDNARKYDAMTTGKRFLLLPAIKRCLEPTRNGLLVDVGCGPADFAGVVKEKGYHYIGLDISHDLLARAQKANPESKFIHASATHFAHLLEQQVDVTLCTMLFPAMNSKEDIALVLKEMYVSLKNGGQALIGVTHPSFDHYMLRGLLDKKGVETSFKGYFDSGSLFLIHRDDGANRFTFEDYHWTLEDYFSSITCAGLSVQTLDECRPETNDVQLRTERERFPSYLLFVCKKE